MFFKSSTKNRNLLYSLLNFRTSSTEFNALKNYVSPLRYKEAHLGPTLVPNGCWDQKIDHFPWSVPPSSRSCFGLFRVARPLEKACRMRLAILPDAYVIY
jgi:hypothetical protein